MRAIELSEEELEFIYFVLDLANDHSLLEDSDQSDRLHNLVNKFEAYLYG